jgi:hypothetical protein
MMNTPPGIFSAAIPAAKTESTRRFSAAEGMAASAGADGGAARFSCAGNASVRDAQATSTAERRAQRRSVMAIAASGWFGRIVGVLKS